MKLALSRGRFRAEVDPTPREALAALAQRPPHRTVAAVDLGQGRLLDRLAGTTARAARVPNIALTRRGNLKTKLAAFAWGVDDILAVPFSPEELLARVRALLRRRVTFVSQIFYGQAGDEFKRARHPFGFLAQYDFIAASKDFHFVTVKAEFFGQPDGLTIA